MANIVICSDGTWNRPEKEDKDTPTNVLRISRAITPHKGGLTQHVFYDWGIGSYHDNVTGGITGKGLEKNIKDGYRYIVQNYNEGDRIFLFGFSRGAYTSRAICGLVNNCGILKRKEAKRIEQAWELYRNSDDACKPNGEMANLFRKKYSYEEKKIHFVGVWDTVGALGIPVSFLGLLERDEQFYDTKMGRNINIARHALAIDEAREDFEPTIWKQKQGVDIKQIWFAGVHCDIGGSYARDKNRLLSSNVSLSWMVEQAKSAGLIIEPYLLSQIRSAKKVKTLPELHNSRINFFRLKEPVNRTLRITDTLKIHASVKERYEIDSGYRPEKLVELLKVKSWDDVIDV